MAAADWQSEASHLHAAVIWPVRLANTLLTRCIHTLEQRWRHREKGGSFKHLPRKRETGRKSRWLKTDVFSRRSECGVRKRSCPTPSFPSSSPSGEVESFPRVRSPGREPS